MKKDVLLLVGAQNIATRLRVEGYRVVVVTDREELFHHALSRSVDIIVLDVAELNTSCESVRQLRTLGVGSPILVLSSQLPEIVSNGTEYLVTPFTLPELLARMRMILSPGGSREPGSEYYFGDVRVDLRGTEILRCGNAVIVSAREFQLLTYFLRHVGVTLSRERLLHEVWGYREVTMTRTVDVHIASLRRKLEGDRKHPRYIVTVKGLGYKFAEPVRKIGVRKHLRHGTVAYA